MKYEISPVEVSDLVPFSPSLNSDSSKCAFAGVSKNGLWMWVVRDTTINIYHTENSEWFGGYCFGESLKDPYAKITSVTEFLSSSISFPCLLIAINHHHEGMICMFDANTSKVVRAVLVPDKVSCLEVVSGNGGACMDTLHLFMQLRYMFGIVAVGTSTGHLYFLDLCLDEDDFSCTENLPNITFVLKKNELIPERREIAIEKQQHVFMLLNDQSVQNGCFEFESRSSSLGHFPYGKVCVSALKYIQSTVTLAIGFNFGGIQLWDLQDLCLLYTVSNQPEELPIIAFAFQEPENDPRHFCYLWIVRGHSANDRPDDFSVATMYSLVYDKRTYVESFGYYYTELRNCIKRFEYRLTSDPFSAAQSSSASGSCLLSCQTVCQTDSSLDVYSPNESDTATENMSLCFLSWVVWSHAEDTPTSYHLALFDLNQWYRAEMPSSNFRSGPPDLNPYFAHFSLEEVAQIFDLEPLLGVYAVPYSIKKFKYISPSEEFFFPSSLDFQTIVFSANGICKTTFMGLQKNLLYKFGEMGPAVLVNPKDIYSNLIRYGLVSELHNASDRVPLLTQRETLMQLALEYHMPFFFIKCLKEWRYADSIQEGCTSRALLNWAWKKVIQIKSSIDKLTIPLFNCSGSDVDKVPLKSLYSYRRQLDLIDTIFVAYQKYAAPRTEQGIQELKCRKDVVSTINMYLQVMLWLRSVHILPEVFEGEESDKNILYPANALKNSYSKRRSQLQKIHSSIGLTDILIIDGLIKESFSENTWHEKGGNGMYPPPSIYAALSCYLLDDVPLELKHYLMYYLLLDVCNAPQNAKNSLISEVKKFPVVFGLSLSVAKLVEAFWYLDRFNFEVAIKNLLHHVVKASDILPWQHHRAIKSFLYQGEPRKALNYINYIEPPESTIEDMKLHLSVLLAQGAIIRAFEYQRSKQATGFGAELLSHLFLGCQEMHKLNDVMYMPLNTFESATLVKFLSENEDPHAQEALVMYHLLHCNYFEAAKINEKLSTNSLGKTASARERIAGRNALVEGFLASIPKAEKNLVDEINRFPSVSIRKTEDLKPLSLSVKSVPMKQITYSDILNSLISEASSTMNATYLDPLTPLKSFTRSYENMPFLRPPLTPERTQVSSGNIHSTPVTKRTLTSPSSEFASPSKKSRLLDNAPFRTPLSKKKIPKHLAGDVASLLQSPPIPKRSSKHGKDISDLAATAPQGILKKKIESVSSELPNRYTSKTPPMFSDVSEDSNSGAASDMNVDDAPDDVPGRQIRFSVPPKEDLNTSLLSCASTASSACGISYDLKKKAEELKPMPSLHRFDSSEKFDKMTQRTIHPGLTREPLKSYSKSSPSKSSPLSEPYRSLHQKSLTNISSQYSLQQRTPEPSVVTIDVSDSDSNSDVETAGKDNRELTVLTPVSLSYLSSSVDARLSEMAPQHSPNVNQDSPLNKSGSSSGNSSYNSAASERSFIVSPRRPLRDSSRNTSFSSTSMLSAQEGDQTLLGEQMIVEDNESSKTHSEVDEVSIIGEFGRNNLCVPCQKISETNEQWNKEGCSYFQVNSNPHCSSYQSVEDHQEPVPNAARETKICEPLTFFCPSEASSALDQIFASNAPIVHSDQNSEFFEQISSNEPCSDFLLPALDTKIQDSDNQGQSNNQNSEVFEQISSDEPCNDFLSPAFDTKIQDSVNQGQSNNQNSEFFEQISRNEPCSDFPALETKIQDGVNQSQSSNVEKFNEHYSGIAETVPKSLNEPHHGEYEAQVVEEIISKIDNDPSWAEAKEEDFPITAAANDDALSAKNVPNKTLDDSDFENSGFAKGAPISKVPEYVPIKERIGKSHSVSSISKIDDDDDETYPSLLLQEQMELQKYEEMFQNEDLYIPKHSGDYFSSKAAEKLERIAESSQDMETNFQAKEIHPETTNSPAPASTKNFSQKLTERFDFLSKNSDFYENSKLYRQAMNLLKESDMPQSCELEKKSSRKTRTFVFKHFEKTETETSESEDSKSMTIKASSKTTINEETSESECVSESGGKTAPSKEFLEHPETYEQFTSSIHKGELDRSHQKQNLESSPNATVDKSSISFLDGSKQSVDGKGRKKKEFTRDINKKLGSSIRKAKGKTSKKIEFSFAEPHSPAGPEILEALTTPSQHPVGSFMFSPPLTRGRLRQKKLDESLGSSFSSVVSETSFAKTKKPPVDPILEEIMAEKAPESQVLMPSASKTKGKSSARKKTLFKKATQSAPHLSLLDDSINLSSLPEAGSPDTSASKHRMVLRQTKMKTQTEQL